MIFLGVKYEVTIILLFFPCLWSCDSVSGVNFCSILWSTAKQLYTHSYVQLLWIVSLGSSSAEVFVVEAIPHQTATCMYNYLLLI